MSDFKRKLLLLGCPCGYTLDQKKDSLVMKVGYNSSFELELFWVCPECKNVINNQIPFAELTKDSSALTGFPLKLKPPEFTKEDIAWLKLMDNAFRKEKEDDEV